MGKSKKSFFSVAEIMQEGKLFYNWGWTTEIKGAWLGFELQQV